MSRRPRQTAGPYAEARAAGREALRARILSVASEILVHTGAEGLTMRQLAEASGCSTMVLYSYFGSKDELADGLFREGVARLQAALAAVPPDADPHQRVIALCRAYRATAHSYPGHYRVMFNRAIAGYTPPAASKQLASETLHPLIAALAQLTAAHQPQDGTAEQLAIELWAATHGFISLELADFLPVSDAELAYLGLVSRWLAGVDKAAQS
jgi:AcrR family transcriptional regulator